VNHNNEAETIKLSEVEGKGVMLNFWGTWCPPCRDEMPFMEKLYPEYQEKGVESVAVNLDKSKLKIEQLIEEFGLTFRVPNDTRDEVRELYVVVPHPSTIFIEPDGVIDEVVIGGLTLDRIEVHLQEIQPK